MRQHQTTLVISACRGRHLALQSLKFSDPHEPIDKQHFNNAIEVSTETLMQPDKPLGLKDEVFVWGNDPSSSLSSGA